MKHLSNLCTRALLLVLLFAGKSALAQLPTISSVTPNTGTIGNSITITGSNFNTTAGNNIVYFGATKATVSSASSTSLTVTVPVGSTIDRVSVTNTASNLTGYAQYPFLPTFDNTNYSPLFNYNPVVVFSSSIAPSGIALGDLDNDGKMDIALCDALAGKISIYRNKATLGAITTTSFTKVDSLTGTTSANPQVVAIADLDGDGKLDVAVANNTAANLVIYRNTSSGSGVISFATRQIISTGGCPTGIAIADIDGDGRPDVVLATGCSSNVAVYRNTSSIGSVSFASVANFTAVGGTKKIANVTVADIDGDGMQDIVACSNDSNLVSVLRNSSTSGTISFDTKVTFACGTSPKYIVTGDFDGDGKMDIATANTTAKTVSVLRNTASSGSITGNSLASTVNFSVPNTPNGLTVSDVQSDGKLDIIVSNAGKVGIMRNTASSGSISSSSFASVLNLSGPNTMTCVASGDIDGDGKPDLFGGDYFGNSLVAFRNNPLRSITGPATTCTGTNITLTDSTVSGTWISTNTGIATVVAGGSTSYTTTLTPVAAGTVVIKYAQLFDTVTYTVTIGKSPTAYTVSGGGTACAGSSVSINLSSSDTGVNYQLKNGGIAIGSPVAGTGSALSFTATASGTYTIVASNTAGCSTTMTNSVVVTINPAPTVFNVTGGGQYCPASAGVAIGLSGSQTGISYSLITNATAVSVKAGTNNTISFGSAFSTLGTYTVVATNTTTNCTSNMSGSAVIITDTTMPVIHTKNITAYLDNTGNVTVTGSQVDNASTDNCSIATRTLDISSFNAANLGANTVTLTVADAAGNNVSGTAVVTIADTTRPVVTTQDVTVYLDANGNASVTPALVDNGSTDNVSIASRSLNISDFTAANLGANTVRLTVTDNSGNSATNTAIVTVADSTKPIVHTQNITVYLGAGGNVSITPAQIDNGSTDNGGIATRTLNTNNFSASNIGDNTVTLTVTDNSGNSATGTAIVTVADTTKPVVVARTITAYLGTDGTIVVSPSQVDNGSSDNSGTVNLSLDNSSFNCSNKGANTVTLTASDNSGNNSSVTTTVTVVDTIDPVVNTQNITVFLGANGAVSITPAQIDNGSTDNCTIASRSLNISSFTAANLGDNNVALTVTDNSDNSAAGTAVVTVVDNAPPVVHTQNITVYLDATGHATIAIGDIDNGSTDNGGIASESLDITNFTAANLGANTVTLTVTDGSGNSSTGTAVVTVADNIAPVVHTQNVTVYLDASGNASVTAAQVDNSSTDNGGIASESLDITNFTAVNLGANTVTLTVTDGSGNSSTGTATVTVADNIAPVVHTQNVTVYLDASGNASITPAQVDNGSTDNGGIASRSLDISSFTASNLGANTVTLTVTDGSGNNSTGTATVTVVDNIAPIVYTQNVTVYLDASGNASVTAAQVNNGSTDNGGIATMSVSPNTFTAANLGTNTVTLTVTDGSGNTANGTATVTVVDNTAPVVHTQNVTVYLDASGNASITPSQVDNGSTDNGGIASRSLDISSFTASNLGANTVTLTVTDGSGNSSTGTATVTVVDNVAPVVHTQNVTVYLDASGNASVTAAQVNNGSTDNGGIATMSVSPNTFTAANLGTNTVTLTVTDGSGNTANGNATVTVADSSKPVVYTQNITVYLDANGNASITPSQVDNGSTDNGGIASRSLDISSFTASTLGTNTVTLTVTDGSGNSSTGTATVTVVDNTAPVVHTQNVTVYLDASGNASVTAAQVDNGSTDNGGIASLSVSPNTFTAANLGTNTVTLTVTDGSGNNSTGTATVTVVDNTAPVVHTQNVTVYLDASGNASVTAAQVNNGSTDNGGIASMSVSPNTFTASNLGANTVTLTVTDGSGNNSTGTATVTVADNIAPVVHTQNVTVYLDASGNASITPSQVDNGSTDNGGIASRSLDISSFTASNLGSNTVTLTVTDGSGNNASGTATVTVVDNTAPVVHTQNVTVYLDASGNASVTAAQVNDGSTDNGGIASMLVSPNTFTASNLGSNTVTLTVTDGSGNSASGTATVTIADTTHPVVVTKSATIYLNASGVATLSTSDVNNGSSDNGGIASISLSKSSFGCSDLGINTVTITVTDNSGNTSTGTATVTITDNIAPSITCPAATTVSSGATSPTYAGTAAATDNCSASPIITYTDVTSGGTITRTWKATDASGNYATCSQTITVNSLSATATITEISCHSDRDHDDHDDDDDGSTGAISLNVTGGVGRLSYSWSNGKTTKDISGLDSGTYTVTITDSLGSTYTHSWTLTAPSKIYLSGTVVNALCYGASTGSITTVVSGGTAPYTYSWRSGETTADLTNIPAAHYKLVVTDVHGCKKDKNFEVHQPSAIRISGRISDVSCYGGSNGAVNLSVSGGSTSYAYTWSNGAHTQDVSGLTPGTYAVTVTDHNGCTKADSFTVDQPSAISTSATVTAVSCHGGSNGAINLSVSGGTSSYSYSWNNGSHYQDIRYLSTGSYTVTVTDHNGCTRTASYTVTEPTAISISGTVTNETCNTSNNGAIDITVTGGTAPYSYSWTNGGCSSHTHHSCSSWWSGWCSSHTSGRSTSHSADLSDIEAGSYTVTVTDANGCTKTATFTVTEPTAISASASTTGVSCYGGSNGAINLSVSGGAGSYSYTWSNGAHTQDISGIAAGTYTVTITDTNGCTKTAAYTVTQPSSAIHDDGSRKTNVSCNGGNNGFIDYDIAGGTPRYTYNWSNGATTDDLHYLTAGTYTVIATDTKGCTRRDTFVITQPAAITSSMAVTNVLCKGSRTGAINLTVAGGTTPYSYNWSNGAHTQDISGVAAGSYSVTITDANGCTKTAGSSITEPSTALSASISVSPVYTVPTYGAAYTIYLGYGRSSDSLIATATGGTSGYSYSWSPSSVSSTSTAATKISPTSRTTYTVTVTDANGCTVTKSQIINVIDVRCGGSGNNHKVVVCQVNHGHTHDICIDSSAVASHLAAGDHLGSCDDENARIVTSNEVEPFQIKVFPNPNTGKFTVQVPSVQGTIQLQVIDMTGKVIDSKSVQDGTISQQVEFNLTDAVRGLYFIKVVANDQAYMEKILVQ